jgi:hypothetical protein
MKENKDLEEFVIPALCHKILYVHVAHINLVNGSSMIVFHFKQGMQG